MIITKSKQCIIDCPNELPRFISNYIKSNSLSQNDLDEQINKEIQKITGDKNLTLISIPKDYLTPSKPKLSANSAIKKWYKKNPTTRLADYRIRLALSRILGITYLETFFITHQQILDYTMEVVYRLALLFSRVAIRSTEIPLLLNRYNIAAYLAGDKEDKNYWNLNELIQQLTITYEDAQEYSILNEKRNKGDKSIGISFSEQPKTFLLFSLENMYVIDEKSTKVPHEAYEMLMTISSELNSLLLLFQAMILKSKNDTSSSFNSDFIWNYFKIKLIVTNKNEALTVCTVAIDLIIQWLKELDNHYIKLLEKLGIMPELCLSNMLKNNLFRTIRFIFNNLCLRNNITKSRHV